MSHSMGRGWLLELTTVTRHPSVCTHYTSGHTGISRRYFATNVFNRVTMMKLVSLVKTSFLFSFAASEWIELPKMTPQRDTATDVDVSAEVSLPSIQTFGSQLFTKTRETDSEFSTIKGNNFEQSEMFEKKLKTLLGTTSSHDEDGKRHYNTSIFERDPEKSEDSFVFEDFINETTHFFTEPKGGIAEKMKYLKQLENKLLFQTKMYTGAIWSDRQARGKKLLGFPSMEGALMTIAFLTFAVFLIKIVMQFIQGLQNAEQTLLMTLASTPAPVRISNRPKRATRDLAAAQILRYIDEYSIKHKLHCDYE